jgi:DNA invertase Pin-like site-specific DNA recombinase
VTILKTRTLEKAAMRHVAVYVRVSKRNGQDVRSQLPDLERWAADQDRPVRWYKDKFTGKTMDRPGWNRLQAAIDAAEVSDVVVWRLDRLGRTAKGLTALFHDLHEKKINVISMKDGLDLGTAAGRLMANVLASVAEFETEVRAERILAGQAVARAKGKVWGGGKPGRRVRLSEEKEKAIRQLKREGKPVAEIARVVGLSRPTIYKAIG